GFARGGEGVVPVLPRNPDGGVGEGRGADRLLDRRLLVAGREVLLGDRQGGPRLGGVARRLGGGAKALGGVDLGLGGGDGVAGALLLAGRGRGRDGQGHGARYEERCEYGLA